MGSSPYEDLFREDNEASGYNLLHGHKGTIAPLEELIPLIPTVFSKLYLFEAWTNGRTNDSKS